MKKRIIAMLLVVNMLASILLCLNENAMIDVEQMYTASAIGVDVNSSSVGDTVVFGNYEQDNNTSNGKEPLEWIVLENSDGKLLLISKYALFKRRYNIDYDAKNPNLWRTTWEKCKLRAYLNDDFYNTAFSADEREHISYSYLDNNNNPEYGTAGGNSTTDKVFLLSYNEFNTYLNGKSFAKAKPTASARAGGLTTDANGVCYWWLRSPGLHAGNASYVMYGGNVYLYGSDVGHQIGVRPVIRIQQNAIKATESVSLNSDSMTVKATDAVSLTATVTPDDSGYPVIWSSSNTKVAKVDSKGKVTIVGLGKVTISVKSGECSDSCELNIQPGFDLKAVGGSVRVIDPYGLRFGVQLKKDAEYNKSYKNIVSYGTLIIPKAKLGDAELNMSTPSVMKIAANNIYSSDSKQLTYTGVLVGIPSSSFNDVIAGRGYLVYKDTDGTTHTIYTDVIERTYGEVADSAYKRYAAMTDRNKNDEAVFKKLESIVKSMNEAASAEVVSDSSFN